MQELAETKFAFLDGRIAEGSVVRLKIEPDGKHALESTVSVVAPDNRHIRISQSGADYYAVIPQLASRLRETLNQYTERMHAPAKVKAHDDIHAPAELPITRQKVIIAETMRESEAIAEAEALGHSWFAFRDADVPHAPTAVLYQRVAGGWGIAWIN